MVFVIEGTEWGDEGKGKICDYLAQKMDIVVRHQGGNNAGHSVVVNGVRYALQSLPSGIISENITNVIANGCVVNPKALIEEIERIKEKGVKHFNLLISNRAHIIMPYHLDLDGAYEEVLNKDKIGTTKKGIGPCYMDKMARIGLRIGDLLEPDYLQIVKVNPDYYYAYESIGILSLHDKNWSGARKAFMKCYEYNASNVSYPLMITYCYYMDGDKVNAKKFSDYVLRKMDRNSVEYVMLRAYHDETDKLPLLQRISAMTNSNQRGKMYFYLGLLYDMFGGKELATQYYTKVVDMQSPMFFEYRIRSEE